jgi:hypothetical protein
MATRRCAGRRSTAICRPSMRSSTPAHRWTSRITTSTAGGPFCATARGRIGGGSARASAAANAAVARRSTPVHLAAQHGEAAATAALLGAGADASIEDYRGYAVLRRTGRPPPAAMPPVFLQDDGRATRTIEWAQRRVRGGGGAGAHFRALFRRVSATAWHAATALLLVRSCIRASLCRLRCARSTDAVGTFFRVCCCTAPARTTREDQHVSWSRARHTRCTSECAFPAHSTGPHAWRCRPNL